MKAQTIAVVVKDAISGESTSMNWWCARLLKTGERGELFARTLMKEEEEKQHRLATLSASINLPLYENYLFNLPQDDEKVICLCSRMNGEGWKLSFRMVDARDGHLVFRNVDAKLEMIAEAMTKAQHAQHFIVSVSPYKDPTISGTIITASGDALLEIVYGPHFWLTKSSPVGVDILRCWYRFPYHSVQYSTADPEQRSIIFHNLRDVLRLTLGINLRQLYETKNTLYAEYHWRDDLGYRFLDCSYSAAWTGRII